MKYHFKIRIFETAILTTLLGFSGCNKFVKIPGPQSQIVASQVFSTDDQATSAMAGVYLNMINTGGSNPSFSSGALSIFCGMSADDLLPFDQASVDNYVQFSNNSILTTNPFYDGNIWQPAYSTIYQCNAVIDGLSKSNTVHSAIKNELTAEATFVRALCYFYLVNLYGDVPLALTIDYNITSILPRSPSVTVYNQIISDLISAQNVLPNDNAASSGNKILPTKWAATALLARVYLYTQDYKDAEIQADALIKSGLFPLTPNVSDVFLANSPEAIWQLQQPNKSYPYNGLTEGVVLVPLDSTSYPFMYLTKSLLHAFEPNDKRRSAWVDSTTYNAISYYYPYKYTQGVSQIQPNGTITQYYMVLRSAETYLIRAEAQLYGTGNGISGAIADLNLVRNRAGLANYAGASTTSDVLAAIMQENRVEFFAEWGHRWVDLKRWKTATQVLSQEKGFTVTNDALLYPIPINDLQDDPHLKQNPGYQGF